MAASDANAVLEALQAAYGGQTAPERRIIALEFLEKLKSGSLPDLGRVADALLEPGRPSVSRVYGCQVLQHLVRVRWKEFGDDDRSSFTKLTFNLLNRAASEGEEWAIKSKVASVFADVVKQEGSTLWLEVLPSLVSGASTSPNHAEVVALVMQFVAEDVTIHNEDLGGEKKRALLAALGKGLPQVLPFMSKILEQHLQAAMVELQKGNIVLARVHAAVVSAALGAERAHVEWAPVGELAASGLIEVCATIMQIPEFRVNACEVLYLLAGRRRSPEDAAVFDAAMVRIFNVVCTISSSILPNIRNGEGGTPADVEFAEALCKILVALSPTNARRVVGGSEELLKLFLELILAFFQHPNFMIHGQATTICLAIAREGSSAQADGVRPDFLEGAERTTIEKKTAKKTDTTEEAPPIRVPEAFWLPVVDVLAERIVKKGFQNEDDFELGDYTQYRGKLVELLRIVTAQHPLLVARRVIPRVDAGITAAQNAHGESKTVEDLDGLHSLLDSMVACVPQLMMATAVLSTAQAANSAMQEYELGMLMEGLATKMVMVELHSPSQLEQQAHLLAALGPYLKHGSRATSLALPKLFSLLATIPKEGAFSSKEKTEFFRVRQGICMAIVHLAKTAGAALSPHLEAMAEQVQSMRGYNDMQQAELNYIGEALLFIASAAGSQQQAAVVDWLLSPIKHEWAGASFTDSTALAACLGNVEIWKTFHTVALFSKVALRVADEVLCQHLVWILPPLLQLLHCIHCIWSPAVRSALPPPVEAALQMGPQEIAALISDSRGKGMDTTSEEDDSSNKIRNWLKGVRENGYSFLGSAATKGKSVFFERYVVNTCGMLLEDSQWMELRHLRQMIRTVVIPIVKSSPREHWESCLGNFLPQLLGPCQVLLDGMWRKLLQQNSDSDGGGSVLVKEMIEEKLLRELTREVCGLLALVAESSEPDTGQMEVGQKNDDKSQQNSLLSYVLQKPEFAKPVLLLGASALTWPDSETIHKALLFCAAVTALPKLSHPSETYIREFVGRDMLQAAMYSLTLNSSAGDQADILGLIRDVYLQLSPLTSAPREVFLCLPGVSHTDVAQLEAALKKTGSSREQRLSVKQFLLQTVKIEHLKALSAGKSSSAITNHVAIKFRSKQHRITGLLD